MRSGRLGLVRTRKPEPRAGEVLVKLRACGICGTDIEKLAAQTETPPVLGHELVGEVSRLGTGVKGLEVGQRVAVHHHVSCGKCYYCLHGDETQCSLFRETNVYPCGFSEFFLVPRLNVERGAILPLPPNLEDREAVFIEPLACCLKALSRITFDSEYSFCVLGSGSMGLLFIKLLRLMGGTRILAVDPLEGRRGMALKCGASLACPPTEAMELAKKVSEGRGVDVSIVATGNTMAFEQGLELVRGGGTVLLFGAPPKEARIPLRLGRLFYDEVRVVPSYSTTEPYMLRALALLVERRITVGELVTHTFELSRIEEAFREAERGERTIKVVVTGPVTTT
jgi:L-iditol 2-dehydrogenase